MLPELGRTSPSNARPRVDLPEPDSPTTPSTSPRARSKSTPSMACTMPDEPPRRRAAALVRSAYATRRSRTLISGSPATSSSTVVGSGFVGNSHLRSAQRLPVSDGEVIAKQPAVGHVTRLAELRRLAGRADVHGVRAARVEPARGWRLDQIRRGAEDRVQGLGCERDRRAQ